jgi:hypothetical protein
MPARKAAPARNVIECVTGHSLRLFDGVYRKLLEADASCPKRSRIALLIQRILQAAKGVLRLAFCLVALAVSLKLDVTEHLADGFLDGALSLLD